MIQDVYRAFFPYFGFIACQIVDLPLLIEVVDLFFSKCQRLIVVLRHDGSLLHLIDGDVFGSHIGEDVKKDINKDNKADYPCNIDMYLSVKFYNVLFFCHNIGIITQKK